MNSSQQHRTHTYLNARQNNSTWLLLASRRAPLVLGCLQTLFEQSHEGVPFEEAVRMLAELLEAHANDPEFEIADKEYPSLARQELNNWRKRGLIVERNDLLQATDALEKAFRFVEGLEGRLMTSTASRLSTVQQKIERLETNLNPNPKSRALYLENQIKALQMELEQVQQGKVQVLSEAKAIEEIGDVYTLASGLRADFRRVEDSWRAADRALREKIISEQQHRGEIVESLLNSHDALLDTPEGQVFQNFHLQLRQSSELENMKHHLRTILNHPAAGKALNAQQQHELRTLTMRLVKESATVIQARARSEHDVKGFLKTGLAAEHHRVGALLNEIFQHAIRMPWEHTAIRQKPSPLPPIAIACNSLPLIERLRFKASQQEEAEALTLARETADLTQIEADFWQAFDSLDRHALIQDTLRVLQAHGGDMTLAELAAALPPTHDLETLALWLSMAREAELPFKPEHEIITLTDTEGIRLQFQVPKVYFNARALVNIEWEL